MSQIQDHIPARNSALIIPLSRPRIEREHGGEGTLVILGSHGWLCGDRRQALREFAGLVNIERKQNSALDAFAAGAAILVSLLLQHGATPAEIGHALRRAPDGTAASLVGAVVDRLAKMGPQS